MKYADVLWGSNLPDLFSKQCRGIMLYIEKQSANIMEPQ